MTQDGVAGCEVPSLALDPNESERRAVEALPFEGGPRRSPLRSSPGKYHLADRQHEQGDYSGHNQSECKHQRRVCKIILKVDETCGHGMIFPVMVEQLTPV